MRRASLVKWLGLAEICANKEVYVRKADCAGLLFICIQYPAVEAASPFYLRPFAAHPKLLKDAV